MQWHESMICDRLHGPFPAPANLILRQVRNGTGYVRARTRTADALIVSTWPSRGLWLAGVEVKVSPYDWRREVANPAKSAEIQQWCKYWYIAAPVDCVPTTELPETWGLIECTKKQAKIVVKAPELSPKPPDIALVCSICRAIADGYTPKSEVRAAAESLAADMVKSHDHQFEDLKKAVADFEKASGLNISSHRWDNDRIGAAAKAVMDIGLLNGKDRLKRLRGEASAIVEACDKLVLPGWEVER